MNGLRGNDGGRQKKKPRRRKREERCSWRLLLMNLSCLLCYGKGEGKGEIDSFAPFYTHKRLVWVDTIDFIVWIIAFFFFVLFVFFPPWPPLAPSRTPRRRCLVACFFLFSNSLGFFIYHFTDGCIAWNGRIARMYK